MKQFFFYKLYLFDKRLFYGIIVFCVLTLLCNIKGDEITPFFIWAMYSEKEKPVNHYQVFRIQVNDSMVVDYTRYTDNNRFFLTAPLTYYNKLKVNDFKEPTLSFIQKKLGVKYHSIQPMAENIYQGNENPAEFAAWYARYLQQSIGRPIHTLMVDVTNIHFTANSQPQADSSYSLIKWKQQ